MVSYFTENTINDNFDKNHSVIVKMIFMMDSSFVGKIKLIVNQSYNDDNINSKKNISLFHHLTKIST